MDQVSPIHTTTAHLSKINLTLSAHLRRGLPSGLFPSGFAISILHVLLSSRTRVVYPVHLTVLGLIILIILGEEYKLLISSLCIFLQLRQSPRPFGTCGKKLIF
jgi:hypothetical protein